MTISETYVDIILSLFESNRNEENAVPMAKYMRNRYPFLGIKTPQRRNLMRQFYKETNILKQAFLPEFVWALWELEEREYQQAALDYMDRMRKKLEPTHMPLMEKLITTKSWWDTVDALASKSIGHIAGTNPEVIPDYIEKWATSSNMWLNRTAILFQLKYKETTDEALLYRYIGIHNTSKEFFIQKAIGWALREYSKTNPNSVRCFINESQLAALSVREGSKYI
ncbi:DNA alkylation repair protein [Oceanobacillus piezotolerans]|uniref:DNA alkylation repair protein n=1 Tax=Oceanobacillus piezotolerans TaxID=2448030 RepID=A0A498D6R5_9BACI|nr:DNA alkylation repair protein [Oceanobacillus piezotolerans]RLL45438.1 DNA alkylation repair protein [Oceanobacillus piezotolerans]